MNFENYFTLSVLLESKIQDKLEIHLRPQLVTQVMSILNDNPQSRLVQYIIKRNKSPGSVTPHKLVIKQVSTLESYNMDPVVYNQLMDVKAGDVGPGEVLIALTCGIWEGGTGGDTDVHIPSIGSIEVKYLGPFAHSTNVPFGSKHTRLIEDTDFDVVIKAIGRISKDNIDTLKNNLTEDEVRHFIDDTIDQIFVFDENLSTNSLRIMGRLLRNAEKNNDTTFSSKGFTFERLKLSMEGAIKAAVGEAAFLMFLGEQTDPDEVGEVLEGQYYIMPKADVKYYMFYRIYKNARIKIAPFATEEEFFEKTITEDYERLNEMPLVHNYEDENTGNPFDVEEWKPDDIFPNEEDIETDWTSGNVKVIRKVDIEYGVDDKVIQYGLVIDNSLVCAAEVDLVNGKKFEVYDPMPIISRIATSKDERGKGYSKFLTQYLLKKYKHIASDLELYKRKRDDLGGSISPWVKLLPLISTVFNFNENTRLYSELDVDEALKGPEHFDIRFIAFDKSYPINRLPKEES